MYCKQIKKLQAGKVGTIEANGEKEKKVDEGKKSGVGKEREGGGVRE